MSILVDGSASVLVQGITGRAAAFHLPHCEAHGTKIVAGIRPGKGGQRYDNRIPIYDTVADATRNHIITASLILVPAPAAADCIWEAIDGEIPLIVCVTEGIPVRDMARIRARLRDSHSILIGANCPGIITPSEVKLGIMPSYIHRPGSVGVVSRSGTLTFETVWQLTQRGIGQSTCVGIGGDPIHGISMVDVVRMFNDDSKTTEIVLVGEIGGEEEEAAAEFIKKHVNKPVVAYIAGVTAPADRRMGHAGAIISGTKSGAGYKIKALEAAGIAVARDISQIGNVFCEISNKNLSVKP
ncbi:MAG: succinate--CoA ligase subunit alpha [Puniceicoccales bacterium]|jgi:succinyl-CoA synthetase alpha subunit|nr:succinate--CoA ligase subunit alpha [Puniceicoccales bacterium]